MELLSCCIIVWREGCGLHMNFSHWHCVLTRNNLIRHLPAIGIICVIVTGKLITVANLQRFRNISPSVADNRLKPTKYYFTMFLYSVNIYKLFNPNSQSHFD